MASVANHEPAADDHVPNVPGARGEDQGLQGMFSRGAGEAYAIEADGDQVCQPAGLDRACLRPADAGRTARGRAIQQRGSVVAAAHSAFEPLIELDRTGFLEHVDQGVGVGTEGEAHVGFGQPARGADTVREVTFGRRAEAYPHRFDPRSSKSASAGWVAWTAVKRSDSAPASASSPVGLVP